uniref:Uncharacterized protein n=1 Tax=Theropithecus gelada TaxID=9565 RepID=A0A8D2JU69_THEGE
MPESPHQGDWGCPYAAAAPDVGNGGSKNVRKPRPEKCQPKRHSLPQAQKAEEVGKCGGICLPVCLQDPGACPSWPPLEKGLRRPTFGRRTEAGPRGKGFGLHRGNSGLRTAEVTHGPCWEAADVPCLPSCSEWRGNVVARQVPEASAELCSRNQPWAAATPSSLHPSPQPGLIEGTPSNLNRTLPSGIRGSQALPQGQPPIPGRSSWETMTREPIPPHPQPEIQTQGVGGATLLLKA